MNTMSTSIEWMAGFFEGEGTISASCWKRTIANITISVANCDRELVEPFAQRYGGCITENNRKRSDKWNKVWRWKRCAQKSITPITELMPFFKSARNKRRAQIALKIQALKKEWQMAGRHTQEKGDEYRKTMLPLFQELQRLNIKGHRK